ncbi:MAG TPA: aminoglycoside phosphotransferase family protein [Anaerolineales bacterium]|nr:aminoglycoside phosphotransferase family protein [Anaerolineales bacterium]
MRELPADFVRNVTVSFPGGAEWLERLPDLLDEAAARWDLSLSDPFPLSYNYVCAATRPSSSLRSAQDVVLKIGVPNVELTSEINTLRVYDGQGACQIYAADPGKGLLLLERLLPGRMLVTLEDDDQATAIAADVMKQTHRPVPQQEGFLSLRAWFGELKKLRPMFGGGTGPFPEKSFTTAEGLIRDLFSEDRPQVLLHGDFHHYNILSSGRGWLVIDPKGVAGPAEYEVGPLLMNPYTLRLEEAEALRRTERRIAILSEQLGFERARLRAWAICHSVLSSFWDMTPDGSGGESARAWTEVFLKLKD